MIGRSISYVIGVIIGSVTTLLGHSTHGSSGRVAHTILGTDAPRYQHNEVRNIWGQVTLLMRCHNFDVWVYAGISSTHMDYSPNIT